MYATLVSFNASEKRDATATVKEVTQKTATRAPQMKAYRTPALLPIPYAGDEALALFVNTKMTNCQYILKRKEAKRRWSNMNLPYDVLEKEKEDCHIRYRFLAEIKLRYLLHHTIMHTVRVQEQKLNQTVSGGKVMTVIFKHGHDGSWQQSNLYI
jgi:hypothetical protein